MKKQKGLYTIEAIIAILIFVTGVLGVQKIQANAIQGVSDAQFRLNASYLADSAIGMMWSSPTQIATFSDGSSPDYQAWLNELTASVPGVSSHPPTIVATPSASGTGTTVTVTIFWTNPNTNLVSSHVVQANIF